MKFIINDNGTDREMLPSEKGDYENAVATITEEALQIELQIQEKLAARASAITKLSALGLTEAEINALLGGV
jgi:hypothetical protein